MRRRILISNDDGIYGLGLKPLIHALQTLGEVTVIIPDSERSAASHSITLHKPFRVQTLSIKLNSHDKAQVYITNGTPSDCVKFGIHEILKGKKVDLVVGGINSGPNLGEDTIYSGTVAVARQSAMLGVPSFSISVMREKPADFNAAAKVSVKVAKFILKNKLPPRIFLNVNLPPFSNRKMPVEFTRLGRRIYGKEIPSGVDPRGSPFYWLAGVVPTGIPEEGTDIGAVKLNRVSVTPLDIDSTAYPFLEKLRNEKLD